MILFALMPISACAQFRVVKAVVKTCSAGAGRLLLGTIVWGHASVCGAQASPVLTLKQQEPALNALLGEYKGIAPQMEAYIKSQGYRNPFENLAGVIHELIHIASAHHEGYFIDGVYYEPYLNPNMWTSIRNSDVVKNIKVEERSNISELLIRPNPNNSLGNVLDEVNAYSHVLMFVCRNEPNTVGKQIANLDGLLKILEGYLRTIREKAPEQYRSLMTDRISSGVMVTILQRAWLRLRECDPYHNYVYTEATVFVNSSVDLRTKIRSVK